MHIFVDESGSFSWRTPGISLMVALVIPDGAIDALTSRFLVWKGSIIGTSTRELKGSELDSNQLESFVQQVLPHTERAPVLTVVGADTSHTQESHVTTAKNQLSEQYAHTAKLLLELDPPNEPLAQAYTEASGWTKKRSAVNFLWIASAEKLVAEALQLMFCAFMERRYDQEFENIEVQIDKSFITRARTVEFWKEYVRLAYLNRAKRREGFLVPRDWRLRNHPYHRKYRRETGIVDLSDLFYNHMNFADSKASIGIQITDICAQICRRFHAGSADLKAYDLLQNRIVGRGGNKLLLMHFDQTSVWPDAPQNHVRLRTTT